MSFFYAPGAKQHVFPVSYVDWNTMDTIWKIAVGKAMGKAPGTGTPVEMTVEDLLRPWITMAPPTPQPATDIYVMVLNISEGAVRMETHHDYFGYSDSAAMPGPQRAKPAPAKTRTSDVPGRIDLGRPYYGLSCWRLTLGYPGLAKAMSYALSCDDPLAQGYVLGAIHAPPMVTTPKTGVQFEVKPLKDPDDDRKPGYDNDDLVALMDKAASIPQTKTRLGQEWRLKDDTGDSVQHYATSMLIDDNPHQIGILHAYWRKTGDKSMGQS